MPFSVSLLFACPWYQEAVEILLQMRSGERRAARGRRGPAAGHVELVPVVSVRSHLESEEATAVVPLMRLQDEGSRAVAEEDAGRAVGPVDEPGKDLAADDEDVLRLVGLDQAVGEVKSVEEADAGRRHVGGRRHGAEQHAEEESG